MLAGKNVPLHMFPLPRTQLGGGGVLGFNGVAWLDRPASMLKDNLRDYRRLGLYVDSRIALRKAMARFWARGNADESIERAPSSAASLVCALTAQVDSGATA